MPLKPRVRSLVIDDQEVHIRPLKMSEWERVDALRTADDMRGVIRFVVACGWVNADGTQVCHGMDDPQVLDLDMAAAAEIHAAVSKLSNTGTLEEIEKNLPATS